MGRPKAWLPFGPETMAARIARIVRSAVGGPIVVVGAPGQDVPPLPVEVLHAVDEREGRGPLEGLQAGLKLIAQKFGGACNAVFATSCDAPLLRPELVQYVAESLEGFDATTPQTAGFFHPLTAAYRVDAVLPKVVEMLAADCLRPARLFDVVRTRILEETELRAVDPELDSFRNLNTPDDYADALRRAGFDSAQQ